MKGDFMKISTRGRYGLRAMVDIASQEASKCVTIKSISERQGISEHYLEQLIAPLKKSGLLKSIRGAQGGYILNAPSTEITVGDILRVMEGSLKIVDCNSVKTESGCGTDSCKTCVTKSVWAKMHQSINEVVDGITLDDLVNDYKILIDLESEF